MSQGIVKYHTIIYNGDAYNAAINFLRIRIYSVNEKRHSKNYKCLKKWTSRMYQLVKLAAVIVTSVGISLSLVPVVTYYITKDLIMEVYMPGIGPEGIGFIILTSYHLFITIAGTFGTFGSDINFIMLILHIMPLSELFEIEINNLRNDIQTGQKDNQLTVKNVIKMHQDMRW